MNTLRATVLALMALLAAGQTAADQRDTRLDDLFARLQSVPDSTTAQTIQSEIWRIWYEHQDNAIVLLMKQGHDAMARRDFNSALRSFDQVVKISPDFAEGWNARATLYYLRGKYDKSLDDIDKTLALEPRHFGALSGRGLVYLELENWDLALQSFDAALDVHPQMVGPRINAEAIRKALQDREI